MPPLRRALQAFRDEPLDDHEATMRWLLLCPVVQSMTVFELWDDDAFHALATRAVRLAREAGALTMLPVALVYLSGRAPVRRASSRPPRRCCRRRTRSRPRPATPASCYGRLLLGAWRGDEAEARAADRRRRCRARRARGEGRVLALAGYATAVLNNGLGRYDAAARRRAARQRGRRPGLRRLVARRAGRGAPCAPGGRSVAAAALPRLEERTRAAARTGRSACCARSQALLSEGDDADALYREAIERLGAHPDPRRARPRAPASTASGCAASGQRVDAREQLRTAHERFARFGAEAFAERARRELRRTGETVRRRTRGDARRRSTPQEAQIARLAAEGQTNPEIGAQLFISPRTVEYHLRKVFTKLGISSRRELGGALGRPGHPGRAD